MAFGQMLVPDSKPNRLWAIEGFAGDGKSLFTTRLAMPMAVIDADNKYQDAVYESGITEAFTIASKKESWKMRDVDEINTILHSNMKSNPVGTILVDSLTPIIQRIIVDTQSDNSYTKGSDWKEKANAMKRLSDVTTAWGSDVVFIYHINPLSVDAFGKEQKENTRSVTDLELARLRKFLNAQLRIVRDGEKRGVKVVWSRLGRSGETLWDESGTWEDMPEKIEAYMYDDLSQEEKQVISSGTFNTPVDAIAFAMESGKYKDEQHAKNDYAKAKKQFQDDCVIKNVTMTSAIMFGGWREWVEDKPELDDE